MAINGRLRAVILAGTALELHAHALRLQVPLNGADVARSEGDEVLLEHAMEEPDVGLARAEDEPALVGVTADDLEAQSLVERPGGAEVADGEAQRERTEIR